MPQKERVLIAVKTYPALSKTYQELVCTAGLREDGSWIRLYPIPFRKLDYDKQYAKFQWVEVLIEKNDKDPRPESYRVVDLESIGTGEKIPSDQVERRRKYALAKVHSNKRAIIDAAHKNELSLVTFKPKDFLGFDIEPDDREWATDKLDAIKDLQAQLDMFSGKGLDDQFEVVNKVPYKFFYRFTDETGQESRLMIEDWEIGALYWNCLKRHEGHDQEARACEDVRKKYWDEFVLKRDVYLFLGTTREFHIRKAKNPFIIVGVWAISKDPAQTELEF